MKIEIVSFFCPQNTVEKSKVLRKVFGRGSQSVMMTQEQIEADEAKRIKQAEARTKTKESNANAGKRIVLFLKPTSPKDGKHGHFAVHSFS